MPYTHIADIAQEFVDGIHLLDEESPCYLMKFHAPMERYRRHYAMTDREYRIFNTLVGRWIS